MRARAIDDIFPRRRMTIRRRKIDKMQVCILGLPYFLCISARSSRYTPETKEKRNEILVRSLPRNGGISSGIPTKKTPGNGLKYGIIILTILF